jgi:hypothetical protein
MAADPFSGLRDFDHKPDRRLLLQTAGASGQHMPGGFEMAGKTEMTANFSWVRTVTVAAMVLSLGNLYHSLYSKSRHVSVCGGQLAQLQLIEGQLDTTDAALNAAGSQLNRAKR